MHSKPGKVVIFFLKPVAQPGPSQVEIKDGDGDKSEENKTEYIAE